MGKWNLLYGVGTSNFEKEGYELKDFQVLNVANGTILCSIRDTGKYMLIHKAFGGNNVQGSGGKKVDFDGLI